MVDKNGKTLSEGDKICAEYTLYGGEKMKRTGEIRHIIRNKRDGTELAMITIDGNILGNLFIKMSQDLEKINDE